MNMDHETILLKYLEEIDDTCISIVDSAGSYVCYSKGCELVDGITKDNVLGRNPDDVFTKAKNDKHSKSLIMETLKTQKPIKDYLVSYSIGDHHITVICNTYPIFSDTGTLIYVICTYREVSDYLNMIALINKQQLELNSKSSSPLSNGTQYTFSDIIGQSSRIRRCVYQAEVAAQTQEPVLLYGKTGSGKELFAQSIHNASLNKSKHFVALNCASIPENLLESTLFGTCKGSFTGALDTKGILAEASGSTLFLDEINSMDITMQSKLLRVLETGKYRKVGGTKELDCHVRIISALNEDPFTAIADKKLRQDLYYRLSVFSVTIPALSERFGDIAELSVHFMNQIAPSLGKKINQLSPEVLEIFNQYSWPGNIRELRHILHQSICLADNKDLILYPEHLPDYFMQNQSTVPEAMFPTKPEKNASLKNAMDRYEKHLLEDALANNHFNITQTADALAITRQSLHYKINKYHLELQKPEKLK